MIFAPSRRFAIQVRLIAAPLVALAAACSSGGFNKTEHFAEYGPGGVANYYRVTLSACGENGKVDYRSGWYDARAVDELFGNLNDKRTQRALTAERHGKAIQVTFDNYMKALETSASAEDLTAARGRYRQALNAVSGTTTLDGEKSSPLDHADEKFVMIFSNDPEKVIEAIKGHIQKRKFSDTLRTIMGADIARKDAARRLKLELFTGELASLAGAVRDLEKRAAGEGKDALANSLEALLARLEAAQ